MVDWTGKMWHIYTMEFYAAIENNEFVSFVGTWMNLETIILSKLTQEQKIIIKTLQEKKSKKIDNKKKEKRQEQKIKHHMFSLIGRC